MVKKNSMQGIVTWAQNKNPKIKKLRKKQNGPNGKGVKRKKQSL